MNKKSMFTVAVLAIIAIFGITTVSDAYYIGQTGGEIADLQITLIESGYDIPAISSGIAHPGYFGVQTQAALAKYEANKPQTFGSVSGPDFYGPYQALNNVKVYRDRKALVTATTTPCQFKSPASTSTLEFFSFRVDTGTTTDATVWTVASSTSQSATTTLGGQFSLAAASKGSFIFRPTGASSNLISPNTWVVLGVQGTKPAGTTNLKGYCSSSFVEL